MVQWFKHSLPTNVARVQFLDSTSCGLSLLLVLYSALIGFSLSTSVFPCPQKPTFPNSNSIQMQDLPENHFAVSGASWVNIMIEVYLAIINN